MHDRYEVLLVAMVYTNQKQSKQESVSNCESTFLQYAFSKQALEKMASVWFGWQ